MRAVAKAAGTTTPTVYERYRDRDDILRALRLETRRQLFAAISATRTLREAFQAYLEFALAHSHAYEVLFDGVARPPSLHEPWPSFNLLRDRLAERLGGTSRQHTRLMLAVWSLMHGTAMLIIRGGFEHDLRAQTVHTCMDALDGILDAAARSKGLPHSGPKWPPNLILGRRQTEPRRERRRRQSTQEEITIHKAQVSPAQPASWRRRTDPSASTGPRHTARRQLDHNA